MAGPQKEGSLQLTAPRDPLQSQSTQGPKGTTGTALFLGAFLHGSQLTDLSLACSAFGKETVPRAALAHLAQGLLCLYSL